jgi:hypothetical protein
MWQWTGIFAKSLHCVLALLATVQPAIVVLCVCPCDPSQHCESPVAQASCDCDEHCSHSEEACSDCPSSNSSPSGSENRALSFSSQLVLHPCGCPKDCDCHLRHSPPIGSKPAEGPEVTEPQFDASCVCVSSWPKPNHALAEKLNRSGHCTHRPLDAPSSCAMLCRFTI